MTFAESALDQTISHFLRERAQTYPQALALVDGTRRLSFAELDAACDRLSAAIAARNVRYGDRVALLMADSASVIELIFAITRCGAIVVPLNWRLSAPEISYALEACEPALVFVSERFTALIEFAPEGSSVVCVSDQQNDGHDPLAAFAGAILTAHYDEPVAADSCLILFTSGTTGRPKGCLHSNRALTINALSTAEHLGLNSDDRLLLTMPLFHVGGLGLAFAHLAAGGAIVAAPPGCDAAKLRSLILSECCTSLSLDAGRIGDLSHLQEQGPHELGLRRLVRGGGMQSVESIHQNERALGLEVVLSYGQTEACGQTLYMRGADQDIGPRAVGRPARHVEARLVDTDGMPVAPGVVGELELQGPTVMLGYWNDSEASAQSVKNGWLSTGDSFYQDAAGFLHFVGRIKELVKSGGENVYPAEVEQVLLEQSRNRGLRRHWRAPRSLGRSGKGVRCNEITAHSSRSCAMVCGSDSKI